MALLAATFHVGASPIRRDIATEAASEAPSMLSRPTEVSLPVLINGRRAHLIMPPDWFKSSRIKPSFNAGAFGAPGQDPTGERRGRVNSLISRPADVSMDAENNWVLGSIGEGEEKTTARVEFSPDRPKIRSFGASVHSIRSISKAGPGDEADQKQVSTTRPLVYGGRTLTNLAVTLFTVVSGRWDVD